MDAIQIRYSVLAVYQDIKEGLKMADARMFTKGFTASKAMFEIGLPRMWAPKEAPEGWYEHSRTDTMVFYRRVDELKNVTEHNDNGDECHCKQCKQERD